MPVSLGCCAALKAHPQHDNLGSSLVQPEAWAPASVTAWLQHMHLDEAAYFCRWYTFCSIAKGQSTTGDGLRPSLSDSWPAWVSERVGWTYALRVLQEACQHALCVSCKHEPIASVHERHGPPRETPWGLAPLFFCSDYEQGLESLKLLGAIDTVRLREEACAQRDQCAHTYVFVHAQAYAHAHAHTDTHMCAHTYVFVHAQAYAHTHTHTHTHVRAHSVAVTQALF